MKEKTLRLLVVVLVFGMCGCTQQPGEDNQQQGGGGGFHLPGTEKNNASNTGSNQGVEEEGPQYQQPTMDVVKGKPQKFPTRYPIKRYPNAQVALVDVRPNRPPGYMNHVMLKTMDNIPSVDSFYRDKMVEDQWKKTYEYHNEIYDSTKWEKGDLLCEIRISQDFSQPNGKRLVQLLYGLRPKRIMKPTGPMPNINKAPNSPG
jgi:hypothetical protein